LVARAVEVAVGSPPPPPVLVGLGEAEPVIDGDWLGERPGDPDLDGLGEPDCGDGEPDCGEGEPDCGDGELLCGGGLPVWGAGGGGDCGAWLWKIRIAIRTARAASSNISNHDTRIDRQPARS